MRADVRWGEREGAPELVLDSIEGLLRLSRAAAAPPRGRAVLCRFCARLVGASAAVHVAYDARQATAQLCLWRPSSPEDPVLLDQAEPSAQEPGSGGRRDWWLVSKSRRVAYEWIDQEHLAELPLTVDANAPTLVVVGRTRPFTDTDSERLADAHRSLTLLERLVERLLTPLPQPGVVGRPLASASLTAREHQVLEMLGQGLLARSIAVRLDVSERTVHKHLGNVYRKLDAHDRLLAVQRGQLLGLIPATPSAAAASRSQVPARAEGVGGW